MNRKIIKGKSKIELYKYTSPWLVVVCTQVYYCDHLNYHDEQHRLLFKFSTTVSHGKSYPRELVWRFQQGSEATHVSLSWSFRGRSSSSTKHTASTEMHMVLWKRKRTPTSPARLTKPAHTMTRVTDVTGRLLESTANPFLRIQLSALLLYLFSP